MLQQWIKKFFNYLLIPQRYVFCYFGFLAIINANAMRLCLDFTLQTAAIPESKSVNGLPTRKTNTTAKSLPVTVHLQQINDSGWSAGAQTLALVSFDVGYIVAQVPGGRLAESFGGKSILSAGILLSSLVTLATPTVIRLGGPLSLIMLRIILGICEGPTFPSLSVMLSQWVPAKERGTLGVFVLSAGQMGFTLANLVGFYILRAYSSWSLIFYVFGFGALLWFLGFTLLCSSTPAANPYIEETERAYIKNGTEPENAAQGAAATPWRRMLTSAPLWALVSATLQYDWNQTVYAQEWRRLLHELGQHESLWDYFAAYLGLSKPYLCNWLSSLCYGVLCDFLIANGFCTPTTARKCMAAASISLLVSVSAYMTYAHTTGVMHMVKLLSMGAYYAGLKLLPLDMSPNHAGTVMGIANGLGSLPGLIVPLLDNAAQQYNNPIVISLRVALWLLCISLISGEVQDFNEVEMIDSQKMD